MTVATLVAGARQAVRGLTPFEVEDPACPQHRPAFDPTCTTVLYCDVGSRSALADGALQALGYDDVAYLEGGMAAWTAAGLPVAGLRRWHLHTHDAGSARLEGRAG